MIHATLLSQSAPSVTNPMPAPAVASTLQLQSALHDLNNLLLIMNTYTSLAVDKLPVDTPAYGHMRQAAEAVRQAALFAHKLRNELK